MFDVTGDVMLYATTGHSASAKVCGHTKEKNTYDCLLRSPTSHFLHGVLLLIKRITSKFQSVECGLLAHYFLEMNEVKLILQEKADSIFSQ